MVVKAAAGFFADASLALLRICDDRLYTSAGFRAFEAYVRGTPSLGFGDRQACAWVAAARFIRALPPGARLPDNERQVRAVAGRANAIAVWLEATRLSGEPDGPRLTDALVRACCAAVGCQVGQLRGLDGVQGGASTIGPAGGQSVGRPVFLETKSCEWYTPDVILALVREVFAPGGIDTDPCSTTDANTRVGAALSYDAASDGLDESNAWRGNVFLNPPLGHETAGACRACSLSAVRPNFAWAALPRQLYC